ncbi:ABC transporter permease [Zhouia sp. PK063]|uniref:ABC transporter permease n=1 Tax=Zhouia sp. PK063 TaxID=3373602 RepID=UPI00378F59FF
MLRLLQIEYIKLWNNRASKFLIISYFVLLSLIALISMIKINFGAINFSLAEQGFFNFPYIWHLNTYLAAWFKLFLAIVIVSMMSNEYSNKTLKQNLIDGLSKKEFILSKFYTVLSFSIASTIFIFLVSLILGLIYSDYTQPSIIFSNLDFLFAYFLKLVGFFSFCLFLGVLVKRSAFALGFLILWQIFEGIYFLIFFYKISPAFYEITSKFLPLNSMSNLIKEPWSRLSAIKTAANQIGANANFDYHTHWYEYVIVMAWITIFICGSYVILKKRDL